MLYPRVTRRTVPSETADSGVHVSLDELVRLQFRASGFSFLPRQPVHSVLTGRHASRLRGRGLNFEELRGYLPGDDVRSIDWKVTARTDKPHVRVFSEERDRPVWLLVDQRRSMFFGSVERMKSVTAAEAAALAAWRALAQGDRVGALLFNDEEIVEITPQRSRRQVHHILAELVRLNRALRADSGPPATPGQFNAVFELAACRRGDARAADRALRAWMRAVGAGRETPSEFAARDGELGAAVAGLQGVLCTRDGAWSGKHLAATLRRTRRQWSRRRADSARHALPPLNPAHLAGTANERPPCPPG